MNVQEVREVLDGILFAVVVWALLIGLFYVPAIMLKFVIGTLTGRCCVCNRERER